MAVKTMKKENKRICMIVEDEAPTRFAFRLTLEKMNYSVLEAEDALEAYDMIHDILEHGPNLDFILLDLYLPTMGGMELIDRLQSENIDIPLLVTSGYLTATVRKKLEDRRIGHILPKPFRPGELVELISKINTIQTEG